MKPNVETQSFKHFLHPRYWPTWLGLGCLWCAVQLPWRWQMAIGKLFGLFMYHVLPKRRFICCVNLSLAFPHLTPAEREQLTRDHFISLGQGVMELGMSWWGNLERLNRLTSIEGLKHLQDALQQGGVLLLSAHFTSLELGGRLLGQYLPLHVVYRPHQNPLIEARTTALRASRYGKAISRDNIRDMIRSLQQGFPVWYAQDQNFKRKNGVFAPFFGIPAATNTATSRLSKLGKAQVVPFFTVRTARGYLLRFLPPLENFPSDGILDDTTRINQIIEQQVREFPAQYLWTHRRYKDMPEGGNRYTLHSKDSLCKSPRTLW